MTAPRRRYRHAGPTEARRYRHAGPEEPHRYRYVGPEDVRRSVAPGAEGRAVRCPADLDAWMTEQGPEETFTFVVTPDGLLRLAPRRSEHVACAGGGDVLAAGEMTFPRAPDGSAPNPRRATGVSNQSTGYCPDPDSWPTVAAALKRAGLDGPHDPDDPSDPGGFTHAFVFRRCERCGENNVVREGVFVCALCDADLPHSWNLDSPAH